MPKNIEIQTRKQYHGKKKFKSANITNIWGNIVFEVI